MTRKRKHDGGGVRDNSDPLPNNRLEDVTNDQIDASSTRTRRGTLRAIGGLAVGSTIVGAAAACSDDEPTDREKAKAKGRTKEYTGDLEHLPTDETRGDSELGMDVSGTSFTAGDGSGTAAHTFHIARGNPEVGIWWHDRVDMTAYGQEDATEGKPVSESHVSYLAEGGDPVLLVAENDRGMLASPDAEHFVEVLPERIRDLAVGLED